MENLISSPFQIQAVISATLLLPFEKAHDNNSLQSLVAPVFARDIESLPGEHVP